MNIAMLKASAPLPAAAETGALGVFQLKRAWARVLAQRRGQFFHDPADAHRDHLVFDALGLGLEQTHKYLGSAAPEFDEFERWIVATAGEPPPARVARVNAAVTGAENPAEIKAWLAEIEASAPVLSEADLAFWNEHGYVIVHDAAPAAARDAAAQAILDHIGARLDDPESWYRGNRQSIMIQYYQNAALEANRRSPRIHKAYAQLWGTADLWVTTDRVGFNAPERPGWTFQGPDLHWDASLAQPMPMSTQGVLYLTDTPAEQGAFACVPGFHHRLADWLKNLPKGANPREQDMRALGAKPIAGRAGDLVIWRDELPHGASPNRGTAPRIVQYIAMYPAAPKIWDEWI